MAGAEENSEAEDVGPPPIKLPPECGFKEVEQFLDSLNESGSSTFVIDASEVEKMSASCAMVVISALRQAEQDSGKLSVIKPSSEFVDAFSELGIFQDLMKMEFRQ